MVSLGPVKPLAAGKAVPGPVELTAAEAGARAGEATAFPRGRPLGCG